MQYSTPGSLDLGHASTASTSKRSDPRELLQAGVYDVQLTRFSKNPANEFSFSVLASNRVLLKRSVSQSCSRVITRDTNSRCSEEVKSQNEELTQAEDSINRLLEAENVLPVDLTAYMKALG